MDGHLMTDPKAVRTFALAGKARLTLVSKRSQARFSYRIGESKDGRVHFVSVLTGSDNETSYSYLGLLKPGETPEQRVFVRTAKSRITEDAPSHKAFNWFWSLVEGGQLNESLEVWHEGRCGRCGRALTVPGSIASGFGPECINRIERMRPGLKTRTGIEGLTHRRRSLLERLTGRQAHNHNTETMEKDNDEDDCGNRVPRTDERGKRRRCDRQLHQSGSHYRNS